MDINRIEYAGQILPCYIERYPAIKKAQRKFRQYNIPGRNGDVFFQSDAWENVVQPYQIWVGDDKTGAQLAWQDLATYLYKDGYQILKDTYDPDHFRKAVFNGPIDVENSWNTHGRATIEFNCRPERYRVDGAESIHYEESNDASFYTLNKADVYSDVRDYFKAAGYSCNILYAFDIPTSGMALYTFIWLAGANGARIPGWFMYTGADPSQALSWEPNGQTSSVTADGLASFTTTQSLLQNGATLVVPSTAVAGIPYVMYAATLPPDIHWGYVGGPIDLVNPYMPSHPDIVLKCTLDHSRELCAAIIDEYGIYIKGGSSTTRPYYFIDTENMTVTNSSSLTDDRYICDNVRVDAGIQLKSGTNKIFTSAYYELDLTPNWWEL